MTISNAEDIYFGNIGKDLASEIEQNVKDIDSSITPNVLVHLNPIRSGLFQTVNDLGGGGFKPPPTISKTIVSIFTISYM